MRIRGTALARMYGALFGRASLVPTGTLTITMPSSVDEVAANDVGAAWQATGGHTQYGAGIYFDSDRYLYTTVNGVGVDPDLSGTAHEVALTGSAPFSAAAWATAAETVISGAGYTVTRSLGVLTVTVATAGRATTAAAQQLALVDFNSRGQGLVLGATQIATGSSVAGNSTGWIQVLPADVPSVAHRVIGFYIRRGNNVGSSVRLSHATGGAGDGDPETAVVQVGATVGNSGTGNLTYHYLPDADVREYASGTRHFVGAHGDGAASSMYGGSNINDGTYQAGSNNLWLTDGTTGSTTPAASPVGAVTSAINYGLVIGLIVQLAPYQTDGGYRAIGGAVPGRHDGTLTANQTPVNDIFVAWRIVSPPIDEVSLVDTHVRLQAHAAGDTNQIRLELWNPLGGASTFEGDTLISEIGTTSDTQGTGWSSVQSAAIALASSTEYRFSIKGEPLPGAENDTILDVWLGTNGADSVASAMHPSAYAPSGTNIPATEREVDGNVDETQIDFDPQAATASPIVSDGTVISPGNLGMIALYFGKEAPTVVAS